MSKMKEIRIGIPLLGSLRFFYLNFLHLIDIDKATLTPQHQSVLLISKRDDIREILSEAHEKAADLAKEQKIPFPMTGKNDKKQTYRKLLKWLAEGDLQPVEAIQRYAERLPKWDKEDLQKSLYPFSGKGDLALFSALNLDFYGFTRGPFFSDSFKLDVRMNGHQAMLCMAGYMAARLFRCRLGEEWLSALVFFPDLAIAKYDLYRKLREGLKGLDGLKPEEGVILWLAVSLPSDFPDVLMMGVTDPAGQNPTGVGAAISVPLSSFRTRAPRLMEAVKKHEWLASSIKQLVSESMRKGRGRGPEAHIDDAISFVKLLYRAAQGFTGDLMELMLRASRIEGGASPTDQIGRERIRIAGLARRIARVLL